MSAADGIGSANENVFWTAFDSNRTGKDDKIQEAAPSLTSSVWLIRGSNESMAMIQRHALN